MTQGITGKIYGFHGVVVIILVGCGFFGYLKSRQFANRDNRERALC